MSEGSRTAVYAIAGAAVLGVGLLCVAGGLGAVLMLRPEEPAARSGELAIGAQEGLVQTQAAPFAGLLPGTDTSLPWPKPALTAAECNDLTEGGDVPDGCFTGTIACDQTVVGHTRGGIDRFSTEFYAKHFCTPATTNHDGGDERVYRFRSPGRHRVYFTLDTPCADLDLTVLRWDGSGCPKIDSDVLDCDMWPKEGTERERVDVPAEAGWEYLVIVEGKGSDEGAFALHAQCGDWR